MTSEVGAVQGVNETKQVISDPAYFPVNYLNETEKDKSVIPAGKDGAILFPTAQDHVLAADGNSATLTASLWTPRLRKIDEILCNDGVILAAYFSVICFGIVSIKQELQLRRKV